jgi:hypothetical protein
LDLKSKIKKKEVLEKVKTEVEARSAYEITECAFSLTFTFVREMFKDYDGKKKVEKDLLLDEDSHFLHLLVEDRTFSKTMTPDLLYYLRDCCCYDDVVRFIVKFYTGKYDENLLKENCNHHRLRGNRRFCEIILFISQFFGRAELIMKDSQVKELWNTLSFLDDFVMALLDQCRIAHQTFLDNPPKRIVGRNERDDEESDGMDDVASSLESHSIVEERSVSKRDKKRKALTGLAGSTPKKLQTEKEVKVIHEKDSTGSAALIVRPKD